MNLTAFRNEPTLELRRASERNRLSDALHELDQQLPIRVPVMIGKHQRAGDQLVSTDPCDPERVVGTAAVTNAGEVESAIEIAQSGFREWSRTSTQTRAGVLLRAADRLRRDRLRLAALALRECGKPWAEADAEVCEAIDFLEFYARESLHLADGEKILQAPGELNSLQYRPRGIVVVISPWNFPLAIVCGMVSAGLATGNAVILKPAEQSPACAHAIVSALRDAGVPAEALSLLPGEGATGAKLVADPRIHSIAFTGSVAVGLEILRSAADVVPGQHHLKRVVAEMGGKNAIIVDSDADLDQAVPAIVQSAFAYAGQKCSAAARVLAHHRVADQLEERLAGAIGTLAVGNADDWNCDVPAVIDQEARERVERYIELAQKDGRIAYTVSIPVRDGWFVTPVLATDLDPGSAVVTDEVFGPLLIIERVKDIGDACDRIDRSPFALTGGLFARNPLTVAEVKRRSPVGNLYINQSITGAMVGRQPFGGNRLSGTGTKAGGPGYLLHFVEPIVTSENTMRHGLVI